MSTLTLRYFVGSLAPGSLNRKLARVSASDAARTADVAAASREAVRSTNPPA